MRVYLVSDYPELTGQSGIGRARQHQMMALDAAGVSYTTTGEEPFDLVHVHTVFPKSFQTALKAKRRGIPVIYHAHSTQEDFRNSFFFANWMAPFAGGWFRMCYRSADFILTPTDYSKTLIDNYQLKTPVDVVSNGIDLSYWQSSSDEIRTFRERYGIAPGDKLIISVGLQIKRKGILDFIEMAKRLPDYQFIWFGYTNPKMLSKEIKEALATDLPNLQFPGFIDRDKIRVAYQAADLYLFLTHEETEGIVLLEALASKTETLVRDIPVFNPYYEDRKHLYKGRTLDEFISLTKGMLNSHLPSLVDAGYEKVTEKSIPNIGQELKKHYEYVLNHYA